MGGASSKPDKTEALRLCKARKRFIKQAIDSRYAFAAAHISYVQSLQNIGIALRRFAEAEVLAEPSFSTSDKTPSHSSYPSPSLSHIAEASDSPLPNESPLSAPLSRMSYMRSGGTSAVTVTVGPSHNGYVHEGESAGFTMPPPPPPPPEPGFSWDFFDPNDDCESFRFVAQNGLHMNFDEMGRAALGDGLNAGQMTPELEQECEVSRTTRPPLRPNAIEGTAQQAFDGEMKPVAAGEQNVSALVGTVMVKASAGPSSSKGDKPGSAPKKGATAEREDPSEFITHRAKDFLSSIKDIEHRFVRASESGKEVSRMLEANKIRVGYSEAKGGSSSSDMLVALRSVCCRRGACCQGKTALVSHEPSEHVTKVITWKRSASSRSTSSRNHLASASKDKNDDSGSDFIEEFCMIAGNHSSTLDRLYAWERKLYDEVKAGESIRKEYDQKCDRLRHQFAKDQSTQVIDKTRAVVKDLHSRIRVALHAVDSISERIVKMRDDELQPQLVELIQGLIRMWKAMLECHHAQYITISLAYHAKSSIGTLPGDAQRQIMIELEDEIEYFGLSFANWINSHTSYVEALNGWLQNCILHPPERSKGRKPFSFSPRRVVAPPIFVLCRDWSAGIKDLPSEELSNAIKSFLRDLRHSIRQHAEEVQQKQRIPDSSIKELEAKDEDKIEDTSSSLSCIHTSLAQVLNRLTKFSEASLKMYEDIREKSETARTAYSNYRPPRYSG